MRVVPFAWTFTLAASALLVLAAWTVRDPLTGLFNRRYLDASLMRLAPFASWKRGRVVVASIVLLVGAWFLGGERNDDPSGYALEVLQELRERTTPEGANVSAPSEPRVREWSVCVKWQVETDLPWADFARWLHEELENDFVLLARSDALLRYSRQLRGDRHLLELELRTHGPPTRVAITLVASPR